MISIRHGVDYLFHDENDFTNQRNETVLTISIGRLKLMFTWYGKVYHNSTWDTWIEIGKRLRERDAKR